MTEMLSKEEVAEMLSKMEGSGGGTRVSDGDVSEASRRLVRDMGAYFFSALDVPCYFGNGIGGADVDKIDFGDFIRSINSRAILTSASFGGVRAFAEIDPLLFGAMFYDRAISFLNGELEDASGEEEKFIERLFEKIERSGFHEYGKKQIAEMERTATKPVLLILQRDFSAFFDVPVPDDFRTVQYPSEFSEIIAPETSGVLISVESKIGESSGFVEFFLPGTLLKKKSGNS